MGFFAWLIRVIGNEYERRIRAASEVTEYGIHHHHGHDQKNNEYGAPDHGADTSVLQTESDDESSEIQNVPPGTHLRHSSESQPDQELTQ
jgi:hypothetical protein